MRDIVTPPSTQSSRSRKIIPETVRVKQKHPKERRKHAHEPLSGSLFGLQAHPASKSTIDSDGLHRISSTPFVWSSGELWRGRVAMSAVHAFATELRSRLRAKPRQSHLCGLVADATGRRSRALLFTAPALWYLGTPDEARRADKNAQRLVVSLTHLRIRGPRRQTLHMMQLHGLAVMSSRGFPQCCPTGRS